MCLNKLFHVFNLHILRTLTLTITSDLWLIQNKTPATRPNQIGQGRKLALKLPAYELNTMEGQCKQRPLSFPWKPRPSQNAVASCLGNSLSMSLCRANSINQKNVSEDWHISANHSTCVDKQFICHLSL